MYFWVSITEQNCFGIYCKVQNVLTFCKLKLAQICSLVFGIVICIESFSQEFLIILVNNGIFCHLTTVSDLRGMLLFLFDKLQIYDLRWKVINENSTINAVLCGSILCQLLIILIVLSVYLFEYKVFLQYDAIQL